MFELSAGAWVVTAVHRRITSVAQAHLSKRAPGGVGSEDLQYELPSWTIFVILGNLILFIPVIFIVSYTFKQVFPVLAIVESDKPEYEPVPLAEGENAGPATSNVCDRTIPITYSFRATNRLLRANGGFAAYARGFLCMLAYNLAVETLRGIFAAATPILVSSLVLLLACLAVVQLNTAWVHILITPRSSTHFWQRLPPFRRTFDATALPTAVLWLALQVCSIAPAVLASVLGLRMPDVSKSNEPATTPPYDATDAWKTVAIGLVTITISVCLVIPSHAVLVRIQASLLPVSDDTIITFDRSFGGAVPPAIVDGKGYATMAVAWQTFSLASWRRLLGLYLKIFVVNIAAMLGMALVIAPQAYVVYRHSTLKEPSLGSS